MKYCGKCQGWAFYWCRLTVARSDDAQVQIGNPQETQDELMNLMTIMYIAIQETLNDPDDMSSTYAKLRKSQMVYTHMP